MSRLKDTVRKLEKRLCCGNNSGGSGNRQYNINTPTVTLDTESPLLGWTQPTGAAEGDTATVNFNYNTQGHYTYQGGQWVFNFKTGLGYNEYTALFYKLPDENPVVTVLKNDFNQELEWTDAGSTSIQINFETPILTPSNTFINIIAVGDDTVTNVLTTNLIDIGLLYLFFFDINGSQRTQQVGTEPFPSRIEIRLYP